MQRTGYTSDTGLFSQTNGSGANNYHLDIIKRKFAEISAEAQKDNSDLKSLANDVYLFTKDFLEKHTSVLSPDSKGTILRDYMQLWFECGLFMCISETSYAIEYTESRFSKYSASYNRRVPMVAGFNLQHANLAWLNFWDVIFPSVNFHGADFSNAMFPYVHFENCDLSAIKTNDDTNFNQCVFKKCNMVDASVITSSLCETKFDECNITNAVLNEERANTSSGYYFRDCVNGNKVIKY